jgi:hypothetical protein
MTRIDMCDFDVRLRQKSDGTRQEKVRDRTIESRDYRSTSFHQQRNNNAVKRSVPGSAPQGFRSDGELALQSTRLLRAASTATATAVGTSRSGYRISREPASRPMHAKPVQQTCKRVARIATQCSGQVFSQHRQGSTDDNKGNNDLLHHPPPSSARLI